MTPIGNHIKIFTPFPINQSQFIVEKERLQQARVADISPDIEVPFNKFDVIYFYTDKEVVLNNEYFVTVDNIAGYRN